MLEDKYSKHTTYDYTAALNNMISEAKKMEGEFTLARLETFRDVADVIRQYKMKESAPSVRARLGKMFKNFLKFRVVTTSLVQLTSHSGIPLTETRTPRICF